MPQDEIDIENLYDPALPPAVLMAIQQLAREVAELRARLAAASIP